MEKHIDILIVGAGISGIGLVHLSKNCPTSIYIIEVEILVWVYGDSNSDMTFKPQF